MLQNREPGFLESFKISFLPVMIFPVIPLVGDHLFNKTRKACFIALQESFWQRFLLNHIRKWLRLYREEKDLSLAPGLNYFSNRIPVRTCQISAVFLFHHTAG